MTAKLLADDGEANDGFGFSVAISGDRVIVGAHGDSGPNGTDSGSAYLFEEINGVWVQQAKLTASDGAANDEFGSSVAISGDVAIVGAPGNDGDGSAAGSAYVFRYNGSAWPASETQRLDPSAARHKF
jgi:hypothetical protein